MDTPPRPPRSRPRNAATVLPAPPLLAELQRLVSGRQVYIPKPESPAARRWREAQDYHRRGYPHAWIARQLGLHPRYVPQLLAAPPPPSTRARAACFRGPGGRVLLHRLQQHVQGCILYVPVPITAATKRARRLTRLFAQGWTPARVARQVKMHVQSVRRIFRAWRFEQDICGRTVVVGQPLFTAEERQRQAADQEQRRRERRAARQRREEQARLREIYGDADVIVVSVRPLFLD
jgi:hypothetical protein